MATVCEKVGSKALDFRLKKAYTARIHFTLGIPPSSPLLSTDTEEKQMQQQPMTVARGLLIEVPWALLVTFPLAFVVAFGLGLVMGIPCLFGIPVDIDLKRFGL